MEIPGAPIENRFRDREFWFIPRSLSCPSPEDAGTIAKTAHALCELFVDSIFRAF